MGCDQSCLTKFQIRNTNDEDFFFCTFLISLYRGGRLPNRDRYRCVASAKPRPGKISPKNLMPGQKVPKNLMTGQVLMNFRSAETGIFHQVKVGLTLFDFYQILHIFCQKLPKTYCPGKSYLPKCKT